MSDPSNRDLVRVRALTSVHDPLLAGRRDPPISEAGEVFLMARGRADELANKHAPAVEYAAAGAIDAVRGDDDIAHLAAESAELKAEIDRLLGRISRLEQVEVEAGTMIRRLEGELLAANDAAKVAEATVASNDGPSRIEYAERIARLLAGPAAERDAAAGALGISGKMSAAERADAMLAYAPERLAELRHIGAGGAVS